MAPCPSGADSSEETTEAPGSEQRARLPKSRRVTNKGDLSERKPMKCFMNLYFFIL